VDFLFDARVLSHGVVEPEGTKIL